MLDQVTDITDMITYEELISMFTLDSFVQVNPADDQRDTPDLQSLWCVVGKQSSRRVTPAIAVEFLLINARFKRNPLWIFLGKICKYE